MKKVLISIVLLFFTATPALAQTASLSLSPTTGTFSRGCAFSLQVNLNTNGTKTDGTDAILKYDSSRVTATSISSGTLYSDYINSIDDNLGRLIISGLASPTVTYSGSGTLATVNFVVKPAATTGATQITFDYVQGGTGDSNVVANINDSTVDILSSVVNGSYTIGTGNCTTPSTLPNTGGIGGESSPSGFFEEPAEELIYKTLPPAGSEQLTFTLAIIGSALTILGILGLALL